VGALLAILATSLVGLYFGEYSAEKTQQQAIQAYWAARAGVERYCNDYRVPDPPVYELGNDRCTVQKEAGGDLVFTGQCGRVNRRVRLVGGNPANRQEML
jgi:hypothetical protein